MAFVLINSDYMRQPLIFDPLQYHIVQNHFFQEAVEIDIKKLVVVETHFSVTLKRVVNPKNLI